MSHILIIIYIFFTLGHVFLYLNKKESNFFVFITSVLLFFLMSGHEYVGNGDGIDFITYENSYISFDILNLKDFWFYYLFYSAERIGIYFSLNYFQWWAVMTALSLIFIITTIIRRRYNPHLFFFFFMIYYVFVFYGGLKFYYGFFLFQYAFTFLIKDEKGGKHKYILLTLLAGGFHVMYYIFLVFGLVNLKIKNRKYLLKIIIFSSIILSVLIKASGGSLLNFAQAIIEGQGNDNISGYFALRTSWGFLLPIGIHVLTTIYAFTYRNIVRKYDQGKWYLYANSMLYVSLMAVIFYPTFMIALTFMRILTALSLSIIIASGYGQKYFNLRDRLKLLLSGFMIIFLYYYINISLAGYMDKSVLPFFDSYYFK